MPDRVQLGERVVVLGRGGADERPAAQRLAEITRRRLIRIDKHFWPVDHRPQPAPHWARVQQDLAEHKTWVMDADLGPFDIDEPLLGHPDEIWVLDFPLVTIVSRVLQYRGERRDFRVWAFRWHREYLDEALATFARDAPQVRVRVFRSPAEVGAALDEVEAESDTVNS
jgi:hypothetical protein